MDLKQLQNIINTVLQNRGKTSIDTLEPQLHLREDIGFDSLDLAELTTRIEVETDIDIFEEGIVQTVEDILKKLS